MNATVKETNYLSPIFFSLFPGIDSNKKVEELGATMGKSIEKWTFIYFPMGQGQEDGSCWKDVPKKEKWIMLQNLHLMSKWFKRFVNELETVVQTAVS